MESFFNVFNYLGQRFHETHCFNVQTSQSFIPNVRLDAYLILKEYEIDLT